MTRETSRVVIVGRGHGGSTPPAPWPAVGQRDGDRPPQLPPLQPLLYQVATAALSPGEMPSPSAPSCAPLPQRGGAPGRGDRHRPPRAAVLLGPDPSPTTT